MIKFTIHHRCCSPGLLLQTFYQGLLASIIGLRGLDLAEPGHSTLSRRAKTAIVPALLRRQNPWSRFVCWSIVPA